MKKLAALILLACFPPRAYAKHFATSHDYCIDPENSAHYANYDECYAERIARKKSRSQSAREDQKRRNKLRRDLLRAASKLKPYGYRAHPPTTTTCTTNYGTTTCTTE